MFLCAGQKIVDRLFELFPKSKIVVQKRALERRAVFVSHLEKLEEFLKKKQKKMKKIQAMRMRKDRKPSYNESISSDESASINSDDEA